MKRMNITRILTICVLVVLLITGCTKVHQPKLEDVEAYNNRGLAYRKKGQFDRAIENYNKTIEINFDPCKDAS